MWKGTISGNRTIKNSGGAVRVEGGGSFTMHDGLITGNVSAGSAGAIRMADGNFTMYNGEITNNECADSGGFMYMQGGTCTIYNGKITNNRKTAKGANSGGAILIGKSGNTPGSFIMINGEISGNIYFDGKILADYDTKEQASGIGFVMQNPDNQIVTDKVWHELAFTGESAGMEDTLLRRRAYFCRAQSNRQAYLREDMTDGFSRRPHCIYPAP